VLVQLERQKQGIHWFAFTGAHGILERTTKSIEDWCKLRPSMCYFLALIGNVFKTCHDAADDEASGKTKERRRSGMVNKLAHEVYGPNNQVNRDAGGALALGDGAGLLSNRARREALQVLWPSNCWGGIS
jgi:hypothetical protein